MLALVTFGLVHDLLSADVFIYKNTSQQAFTWSPFLKLTSMNLKIQISLNLCELIKPACTRNNTTIVLTKLTFSNCTVL